MSEGAAFASACNSFASVASAFAEFADALTAAAALAARLARSWQFFALAKLGTEPEVVEVAADVVTVVLEVCVAAEDELFFAPPPHPAARVTNPARRMAAMTCFDLDVT
jgi:hypothetical protein